MADWKERLGVVYSTNPDFKYDNGAEEAVETLPKERQNLRVWRDTHGRAGKVATVVPLTVTSAPSPTIISLFP